MGLLLTLNRKIHKAYFRTRDFNFSLNGLVGFDLHGRTVGVIGTGKIGQIFIRICRGFGMNVVAYDPYPLKDADFPYVSLEELLHQSDIISLHCPLTEQSRHLINADTIAQMKDGVYLLNTSRGMLVESEALLDALKNGKIAGAGLDVYEEETEFFFEDRSEMVKRDTLLSLLVSMPNVVLTSPPGVPHQRGTAQHRTSHPGKSGCLLPRRHDPEPGTIKFLSFRTRCTVFLHTERRIHYAARSSLQPHSRQPG